MGAVDLLPKSPGSLGNPSGPPHISLQLRANPAAPVALELHELLATTSSPHLKGTRHSSGGPDLVPGATARLVHVKPYTPRTLSYVLLVSMYRWRRVCYGEQTPAPHGQVRSAGTIRQAGGADVAGVEEGDVTAYP
ncbi:unnamed protein product [Gadus morhua 'NCC']